MIYVLILLAKICLFHILKIYWGCLSINKDNESIAKGDSTLNDCEDINENSISFNFCIEDVPNDEQSNKCELQPRQPKIEFPQSKNA